MKLYLVEHRKEDFAEAFTQHLFSYAIGRELTYRDAEEVQSLKETFIKSGYRMKPLIRAIVLSPLFTERKSHK